MNARKKPVPRNKRSSSHTKPPVAVPVAVVRETQKRKTKRTKTVRDSFNMPEHDYALIALLKKRALASALEVKKSELLRAGLNLLSRLAEKDFLAAIASVDPVKTGRPQKKK
jgi:hypothetical protein